MCSPQCVPASGSPEGGYRWASLPPWSRLPRRALEPERKGLVSPSRHLPRPGWLMGRALKDRGREGPLPLSWLPREIFQAERLHRTFNTYSFVFLHRPVEIQFSSCSLMDVYHHYPVSYLVSFLQASAPHPIPPLSPRGGGGGGGGSEWVIIAREEKNVNPFHT